MNTVPTQHPRWCALEACTVIDSIGLHYGRVRLVPADGTDTNLTVLLWQAPPVPGSPAFIEIVASWRDIERRRWER